MSSRFAPEIVTVTPLEAEFAKLFNNAYRYIEFAATNEFYLIARSAGLDYQRILNAMKHNYPRARNIPRPGYAAGPCLVKDTMQLAAFTADHFPLGAGLGRYASPLSRGDTFSPLYHEYGLDHIWGLTPHYDAYITDTFWPHILGEAGVFALIASNSSM